MNLFYKSRNFLPVLNIPSVKNLVSFGFFFGSSKFPVSFGLENSVCFYRLRGESIPVFKFNTSLLHLRRSLFFISKIAYASGSFLFISCYSKNISPVLKQVCFELSQHFVNFRWVGGMLTNFKQIRHWIKRLYKFDFFVLRKLQYLMTLKKSFDGIKGLRNFPTSVLAVNSSRNFWGIKEASLLRIPVVALVAPSDTFCGVTYPVLCNYFSSLNVRFFISLVKESYLIGKYSFYLDNFKSR